MKKEILKTIYEKYSNWVNGHAFACQKGCSHCCTQSVNMTALEGEYIYDFIRAESKQQWFAKCLSAEREVTRQEMTTNAFARLCLEEREIPEREERPLRGKCPFLEEDKCGIYPARPLGCRSFASIKKCIKGGEAELPESVLVVNTVTMQLVEHLGQKEYWGNMLDVLMAMTDLPKNADLEKFVEAKGQVMTAQARLLKAEPLPGFLLMAEEQEMVDKYLQTIFTAMVGEKSIEQILNNR